MRSRRIGVLIGLMILGSAAWVSPASADTCEARDPTNIPTFPAGSPSPMVCDLHGQPRIQLVTPNGTPVYPDNSSGVPLTGYATAAAPTFAEASAGYFSWDLSGNLRITFGTLLFGENSTYNLLETSGGVVRPTVMASAVTTDTTSTAVALPVGVKTIYGSVDGTGAVTQTQKIYGGLTSGVTATTGELLATLTLSGTTHAHASFVTAAPWLFYIVVSSATSGTSATGVVTAHY